MRTITRDIAGAVILSNDKHILLGKSIKGGVYEDDWVIPAGGVEEGETKEQALVREVLEEVGIDLAKVAITMLPEIQRGRTEKTLRDTGERVEVDMTFYNFKVNINRKAELIPIILNDDLRTAEWVAFSALRSRTYSPSVEDILRTMKLI